MQAQHMVGTRGGAGDFIHIQEGGVGGQYRAGFGRLVQLGEDVFLHVHALKHRLDDQVTIAQILHLQRAGKQRHALLHIFRRQAALGGGGVVILPHHAKPLIQRLLFHFHDGDGDAGIDKIHRDAAAHGAGADHANLLDRQGRRIIRHIGNFGCLAFGEEHMAQCQRLRRNPARLENLLFQRDAIIKGHRGGGFHRLDRLQRRVEAVHFLAAGESVNG